MRGKKKRRKVESIEEKKSKSPANHLNHNSIKSNPIQIQFKSEKKKVYRIIEDRIETFKELQKEECGEGLHFTSSAFILYS